jgi:hypothetical protein
MRGTFAIGLALMLTAFAPPERAPAPIEPTQQQAIPKSWVPDQKPDQPPPITLDVVPKAPSAYSHGSNLACRSSSGSGLRASSRQFVEGYQAMMTAFRNEQFSEAIRLAEIAASHANDAREWTAIEQMRIGAFDKLGNDMELIAALEAALAARDCLSPQQTADYRQQLEKARKRLKTRR